MNIEIRKINDISIVKLSDKLNICSVPEIDDFINNLIEQNKNSFILDLDELSYIDSSGLGALITITVKLKKKGGSLKIIGLMGFVRKIFEVTNSTALFEIYESEEEAVKSFAPKK